MAPSNANLKGHPLGLHRVISPPQALPQPAWSLNPKLPLYDNEILVDITTLQIDAASFKNLTDQEAKKCRAPLQDAENEIKNGLKKAILAITRERGKMHNPHTNSGGVFFGTVREIGPLHPQAGQIRAGDRIVSLVSLTLTPLWIDEILDIDLKTDRVFVRGHALLFASGLFSQIPEDLPEGTVMAMLDVCGAPSQVNRHVSEKDTVLIIGLGKAGKGMAVAANLKGARVFGIDVNPQAVAWCRQNLQGHFEVIQDANPLTPSEWLLKNNQNRLADWVFNATNQDATEMNTILCAREGGSAMFFGMNTSFQKAVLGAEGIGRDVTLYMGSGYVPGHAEFALNLLRRSPALKRWFTETFSKQG